MGLLISISINSDSGFYKIQIQTWFKRKDDYFRIMHGFIKKKNNMILWIFIDIYKFLFESKNHVKPN